MVRVTNKFAYPWAVRLATALAMAVAPHVVRADLADDGIAPVPALARSALSCV